VRTSPLSSPLTVTAMAGQTAALIQALHAFLFQDRAAFVARVDAFLR
jgi:hypothetical protein